MSLLDTLSYPPDDEVEHLDLDEQVGSLIQQLKPREQTVLRLRFGLDGQECQSLSQVSQVLDVSKERIRQIQDAALDQAPQARPGRTGLLRSRRLSDVALVNSPELLNPAAASLSSETTRPCVLARRDAVRTGRHRE